VDAAAAAALLETDPLRNLVTLKMMGSFPGQMTFLAEREGDDWALLSLLPVQASAWDRTAYPAAAFVALPNGNSARLVVKALGAAPRGPIVFKTVDNEASAFLAREKGARLVASFRSFTRGPGPAGTEPGTDVASSTERDPEAWALLGRNGYDEPELLRHFARGARWFGARIDGTLASACFAFPNHGRIWEVGGVYTAPDHRRKGLARKVVLAALAFLDGAEFTPRYQVRADNAASIELAGRCDLREFLRVDHLALGLAPADAAP
jgi:GNAT superfamily N-acetyltransferase